MDEAAIEVILRRELMERYDIDRVTQQSRLRWAKKAEWVRVGE